MSSASANATSSGPALVKSRTVMMNEVVSISRWVMAGARVVVVGFGFGFVVVVGAGLVVVVVGAWVVVVGAAVVVVVFTDPAASASTFCVALPRAARPMITAS